MRKVLLMALSEPEYARVDYWIAEQEKSSYRKETFIKKLMDAHKHYEYVISKKEAEFKALNPTGTISNPQIPLFYETDGKITGHLGAKILSELGKSIIELFKFWFPQNQTDELFLQNIPFIMDGYTAEKIDIIRGRDIYKTLLKVNSGAFSYLEQIDLIDDLTKFDLEKLKALKDDIATFTFIESIIQRATISDEAKEIVLKKYAEKDIEPPIIYQIFDPKNQEWRDRKNSEKLNFESGDHDKKDYLDLEHIFYPDNFFEINFFELIVLDKIKELEKGNNSNTEDAKLKVQPIQWLKGDEALRQFLESLKSAGLIENRETEEIIQEHFFVNGNMLTKEPELIKWLIESKYLAYLMHRLAEEFIINIKGKKHQLTASHFINSEGKQLKSKSLASQLSQIQNEKSNNTIHTIESILSKLKS